MDRNKIVRDSHFPVGLFAAIFAVLLLVAGIHMGLIQLLNQWNPTEVAKPVIIICYWMLISAGVTLFIRWEMKKSYEIPMKELARATDAVAHGDFSVYVAPIHTPQKMDYLDVMIIDFNKMVEELGSIETLKTDFFSNVSHEIKTPLAVVSNYAQLIKAGGELSKEQLEYIEGIITSTKKLSDLITNILKLNRLEKQNIQPDMEEYDLCEQLCECALQYENVWEEKQIEFEVEIEEQITIYGDKSLLELVWNNLLSNALKFTEPYGRIVLQETSTENEVIVKVKDTGCGMDKNTLNHIFDKFYQGDSSHATEGNGLGLALALRVLQISGGSITADSEVGMGTTFTVRLPKATI